MQNTAYIASSGYQIAYRRTDGKGPAVLMAMGHKGTMKENTRLPFLTNRMQEKDIPFICFDYAGWGLSGDEEKEWQVDLWAQNIIDLIDQVPDEKVILLGHSMGGFLMLMAAMARPQKVCGLVGMGSGFGSYIQKTGKKTIYNAETDLSIHLDLTEHIPITHIITSRLPIESPIRLIHALHDDICASAAPLSIMENIITNNVHLFLRKDTDHAMRNPADLEPVINALYELHSYKGNT